MSTPSWLYDPRLDLDWSMDFAPDVLRIEPSPAPAARWTALWIVWGAVFFIADIWAALSKRPGRTLTENLKHLFALWPEDKGTARAWWLRRLLALAAVSWIAGHFLLGGYF